MSYARLLDKKSKLFYPKGIGTQIIGGVPVKGETSYDLENPDHIDVPCYVGKAKALMIQQDPQNELVRTTIIQFLPEYDIRKNMKVEVEGVIYHIVDAYKPRGHHWEAEARSEEEL